jgi:hypothetical protein
MASAAASSVLLSDMGVFPRGWLQDARRIRRAAGHHPQPLSSVKRDESPTLCRGLPAIRRVGQAAGKCSPSRQGSRDGEAMLRAVARWRACVARPEKRVRRCVRPHPCRRSPTGGHTLPTGASRIAGLVTRQRHVELEHHPYGVPSGDGVRRRSASCVSVALGHPPSARGSQARFAR